MTTVKNLLEVKGGKTWTISPDATVYQALERMLERDVGGLLVLQNDKLVGIFTERDYARKLILKGRFSKDTVVSDLMTKNVLYVGPDNTIQDCMMLMTDKRLRHIPVLEDDQLIGIVTIGDVVKQIISEQEYAINQLENYITGSY